MGRTKSRIHAGQSLEFVSSDASKISTLTQVGDKLVVLGTPTVQFGNTGTLSDILLANTSAKIRYVQDLTFKNETSAKDIITLTNDLLLVNQALEIKNFGGGVNPLIFSNSADKTISFDENVFVVGNGTIDGDLTVNGSFIGGNFINPTYDKLLLYKEVNADYVPFKLMGQRSSGSVIILDDHWFSTSVNNTNLEVYFQMSEATHHIDLKLHIKEIRLTLKDTGNNKNRIKDIFLRATTNDVESEFYHSPTDFTFPQEVQLTFTPIDLSIYHTVFLVIVFEVKQKATFKYGNLRGKAFYDF